MPTRTDVSPIFGPQLQSMIERAIAQVPPDRRGHVRLRVTLEGVEAEAAIRIMRGVQAAMIYQRGTDGQQALGGEIRWSF